MKFLKKYKIFESTNIGKVILATTKEEKIVVQEWLFEQGYGWFNFGNNRLPNHSGFWKIPVLIKLHENKKLTFSYPYKPTKNLLGVSYIWSDKNYIKANSIPEVKKFIEALKLGLL